VANDRKRKQTICSLQNGVTVVRGTDELLKLATGYYKALFGPGEGNNFEISDSL
jgi:hypothetical protein